MEKQQSKKPLVRFPEFNGDWEKKKLGVPRQKKAGRAIRSNLFFVPQKRISTTIPNAKNTIQ
jgi:hypothetical protein